MRSVWDSSLRTVNLFTTLSGGVKPKVNFGPHFLPFLPKYTQFNTPVTYPLSRITSSINTAQNRTTKNNDINWIVHCEWRRLPRSLRRQYRVFRTGHAADVAVVPGCRGHCCGPQPLEVLE
jgi:hypothetical protein